MERPTSQHLQVMKHIMRYIEGTTMYGFEYVRSCEEDSVIGYKYRVLCLCVFQFIYGKSETNENQDLNS